MASKGQGTTNKNHALLLQSLKSEDISHEDQSANKNQDKNDQNAVIFDYLQSKAQE